MILKRLIRLGVPVAVFVAAAAVTLFAIGKLGAGNAPARATRSTPGAPVGGAMKGTIEGVQGVGANEVVALPQLPSLAAGPVSLNSLKEKHLLVAFVSSQCGGCAKDSAFWRDLRDETARRGVAFYVINVADGKEAAAKFADDHGIGDLPVLYDPDLDAARGFKVGFAPQYVLLTSAGRVIDRWDGLRHYEGEREKVAQMFERLGE